MKQFQSLFGIPEESVQENCLLLPFLPSKTLEIFGIKEMTRGAIFSSAHTNNITIITTGIGAGFVGDATLYLEKTPCHNIYFLGSCGLITKEKKLDIGDLILPSAAYAFDSFSDIILNRCFNPAPVFPDPQLYSRQINRLPHPPHTGSCASFASLHEEENFIPLFQKMAIDAIEMECAALFLAARKTNKKALALLFISDILGEKRFFEARSASDKKKITNGIALAIKNIKLFSSADEDSRCDLPIPD